MSFAIRARRSGTHPYTSQDLGREAGSAVWTAVPGLRVDLTNPEREIFIEVRENKAYIFHETLSGPGGLPLGTQGRAVGLVESELDLVSAWLLMRRGARTTLAVIGDEAIVEPLRRWDVHLKVLSWEPGLDLKELVRVSRSEALFLQESVKTVERWMAYADERLDGKGIRCYVCPGNDDMFEIDAAIAASKTVRSVEGQVVALDEHHEMASTGWSNPTPWQTHREEPDEALGRRIEAVVGQLKNPANAVFAFHVPPYGSGLDEAPELTKDLRPAYAGRSLVPVGSKSVLRAIETHKPLLGLHGHIHEGKGARKFGRTLCLNPGSMYEQGVLHGALVDLKESKLGNYVLTTG